MNHGLEIQGNDILVFTWAGDEHITIHCEKPVINTQWSVYGGRHVIWAYLKGEGRYFSSLGFYEHAATGREMMDSMQELCDRLNKMLNPTGVEIPKQPDSGKSTFNVTFFP